MRLKSLSSFAVGLSALVVMAIAIALFANPPFFLVRAVAVRNADWLLSNYMEAPSGVLAYTRNGARKLTAMYVQYGMAAAFRRTHHVPDSTDDPHRVEARLVALRRMMLNQGEIPHNPMQWSSVLSGLGYCDQMNAIAANVLGGEFAKAEIIGLTNPTTRAQHTIGRVWSVARGEWLYFDLWGDVAVFRLNDTGRPDVLASQAIPTNVDSVTRAQIAGMYAFAATGVPFNDYPPSLGGFVFHRLRSMARRRTLESFSPLQTLGTPSEPRAVASPNSQSAVRRMFVDAQLLNASNRPMDASAKFGRIAEMDSTSVLGMAARRLAVRSR